MEYLALHVGHVAGTAYYPRGWDRLSKSSVGAKVEFRRDPTNKYDKRATGIYYDGTQIGWVPKAYNTAIAYALDNGVQVCGRIIEHHSAGSSENRLFVAVYSAAEDKAAAELTTILRAMYGNPWMEHQYPKLDRVPKRLQPLVELDLQDLASRAVKQQPLFNPAAKQVFGGKVAEAAQAVDFLSSTYNLPSKGNTMSLIENLVEKNKQTATSAGFMEAGRIANNQIVKLATPHLPILARGYLNTPIGKLVVANLAQLGASKFRPGDQRLAKLTSAMMVQSWQEVFNDFDIEGMIEQLLSNSAIKKALDYVDPEADAGAVTKAATAATKK